MPVKCEQLLWQRTSTPILTNTSKQQQYQSALLIRLHTASALPFDPLQPGPIYFLTPRKCTVFEVNCEAIPQQVNFLTDEAGDCGKGANAVISRLHYFFENYGLGETDVYLHADNCTGQNRNNYDTVSFVAHSNQYPYKHHTLIPTCWTHQVLT